MTSPVTSHLALVRLLYIEERDHIAQEAARRMLDHLVRIESQLDFTPPAADATDLAELLGGV